MSWLTVLLDIILVAGIGAAIFYALRVEKQLAALRASRAEMEKFVAEFSTTVNRAELGIRGLKGVAREAGDDLERVIGAARQQKDELLLMTTQADRMAERLGQQAAQFRQVAMGDNTPSPEARQNIQATLAAINTLPPALPDADNNAAITTAANDRGGAPRSRAEQELMRVMEKLRS